MAEGDMRCFSQFPDDCFGLKIVFLGTWHITEWGGCRQSLLVDRWSCNTRGFNPTEISYGNNLNGYKLQHSECEVGLCQYLCPATRKVRRTSFTTWEPKVSSRVEMRAGYEFHKWRERVLFRLTLLHHDPASSWCRRKWRSNPRCIPFCQSYQGTRIIQKERASQEYGLYPSNIINADSCACS